MLSTVSIQVSFLFVTLALMAQEANSSGWMSWPKSTPINSQNHRVGRNCKIHLIQLLAHFNVMNYLRVPFKTIENPNVLMAEELSTQFFNHPCS